MPGSEQAEGTRGDSALDEELRGLEGAVRKLLEEHRRLRERASQAEGAYGRLAEALREARVEGVDPERIETRLEELVEENRRLREIIEEGHERAARIRSRLIVWEDEEA